MSAPSRVRRPLCFLIPVVALIAACGPSNPPQREPRLWRGQDPLASRDRYIVGFRNPAAGRAALVAAGGTVLLDLPDVDAAAVELPAHALPGVSHNPNIEYIEED